MNHIDLKPHTPPFQTMRDNYSFERFLTHSYIFLALVSWDLRQYWRHYSNETFGLY